VAVALWTPRSTVIRVASPDRRLQHLAAAHLPAASFAP